MPQQQTKPWSGWNRGIAIATLLLGIVALDTWGIRWLRAPWSYDSLGPTLTGTWEGPLQARLGAEYRILLTVAYREPGRWLQWGGPNLTGRGTICTPHGDIYEYALTGVASRSADDVEITLSYDDPAQSALNTRLTGSWNGETLTLQPTHNPFQPDGTFARDRTARPADPEDGFGSTVLHNGDWATFLAACGRLTR